MIHPFKILSAFACALLLAAAPVRAQGVINVYGPGGPAPAMQEAAKTFGAAHQVIVEPRTGNVTRTQP